jgi:ATP-dependent DNA helicase RecG
VSTTPEQINLWRSAPSEHQRLEFKEAKTQFDFRTLCKYCVALANEGGGNLLFGVADKPPRPIVGTAAANDPVGMAEKLFQTLGFRVDVEEVNHPDGRVVVFNIPSRPRGTTYHLDGTYFMRAGEELVPMSEDQLRRIFAEGEPDWLEEHTRSRLDAAQVVELLDTQGFFQLLKLPYPAEQAGVLDRLQQERLVDLIGGSFAIRRLGALLLAKRLQDFPEISRKTPRVVVYTGTSKLDTKLDQPGIKGYATGFRELVHFTMSQLPQNEIIEDALRKEVKLVPEIAIRELVANALIHQDFNIGGASVMVEIYSDRVEISNPGDPIVPVDRFIDGYQSRNERLADLMRRFAICEEKGSGVDKVIQAIELHQLPAPDFRAGFKRFSVILLAPRPFAKMDKPDRIRACYQHCCLRYVLHEKMTNQSLRERFKLPEARADSVSQIIAATQSAGLIRLDDSSVNSKRYARYLPFWG